MTPVQAAYRLREAHSVRRSVEAVSGAGGQGFFGIVLRRTDRGDGVGKKRDAKGGSCCKKAIDESRTSKSRKRCPCSDGDAHDSADQLQKAVESASPRANDKFNTITMLDTDFIMRPRRDGNAVQPHFALSTETVRDMGHVANRRRDMRKRHEIRDSPHPTLMWGQCVRYR